MTKLFAIPEDGEISKFSFLKVCWLLLITTLALGMTHLWLQSQVVNAGWKVKELEKTLNRLQAPLTAMEVKLARLKTPAVIKTKLEEKGIKMDAPATTDVVRLTQVQEYHPKTVYRRVSVSWGQIYCYDPYH